MPTPQRLQLISRVEQARGARLLVYVTGDRRGFETKIATDAFPFILEHLQAFSRTSVNKIGLFLYTTGGLTNAAPGLVSLLREFTSSLSVLIPFKAHSAGTLIALGADSIVMSPSGQLTPVDPSVHSPYNPTVQSPVPGAPPQTLPISVEDVVGFLHLAKTEGGLKSEPALASVFQELASKVHPLALGNVYRAREQIRLIARQLLRLHMKGEPNEERIERIVSALTEQLYSHDYIIGRKEAAETLGLPVEKPNPDWDNDIQALYKEYENLLQLTTPYNQDVILGEQQTATAAFVRAIIESSTQTHAFVTEKEIRRVQVTQPGVPAPIVGFQERVLREGWVPNATV
ncbi:MAG: serine protease [Chloroflexi bacterium]|nr:serine protease [Chloroflexota bacterium]